MPKSEDKGIRIAVHCKAFNRVITANTATVIENMAIEWDVLIAEMSMLGIIVFVSIYFENWIEKRKTRLKEKEDAKRTLTFVSTDLEKKLKFIDDSIQYKDYKPFFTDMWDAVILGGKQTIIPFDTFENLQHTYSWMKYYNNELEQWHKSDGDANVTEVLNEVKGCVNKSLQMLEKIQY